MSRARPNTPSSGTIALNLAFGAATAFMTYSSGGLKGVAPPDESSVSLPLIVATYGVVVAFLFITVLAQRQALGTGDQLIGAALVLVIICAASVTIYMKERSTFIYHCKKICGEPGDYVRGSFDIPQGNGVKTFQAFREDYGGDVEDLLSAAGGFQKRHEQLWSQDAEEGARSILAVTYISFIVSLASLVFCLSQGVLGNTKIMSPENHKKTVTPKDTETHSEKKPHDPEALEKPDESPNAEESSDSDE